MKTRFAKVLVLLTVVVAMVAMTALPAMAAKTVTVLDGNVSVTDSVGNGTVSDGIITITATGTNFAQKTNTVTIANESQDTAKLSFDWAVANAKSYDANGVTGDAGVLGTVDGNGVCSVRLDAGKTITITFKSGIKSVGTATLTLSNFTFELVADSANVTFEVDSTEGSITVGGNAWTSGEAIAVDPEVGVAVTATAKSGYTFVGWVNTETGRVYSMKASDTVTPTTDASIRAMFATSAPTFYVKDQGYNYFYDNWSDAVTAAVKSNSKVMVLANNATLPAGEYTVPAGVTLLIPYNADHTNETDIPVCVETWVKPTQFRALTMANGASITVNGALCVGGQQSAKYQRNGMPTGPVGFIKMNAGSAISVESGANLYAWGYITGSGSVAIKSGGTVYEHFQLADYRGGQATVDAANNASRVFPMSQYYIQNIEVPMTLHAGASEYAYMSTNVTYLGIRGSKVPFVGDSGAMFKISSGYAIKDYLEGEGRMLVEAHGDMSATSVSITMQTTTISTTTIDSSKYYLPISNHFTIDLVEGNFHVAQDLVLYPGAELNIRKGTTATLAAGVKVVVYDVDQWVGCCASSNAKYIALPYVPGGDSTATRLKDAQVLIDGTVEANGAAIYTTAGGANVYSTGTGVVNIAPGTVQSVYYIKQNDTSITHNNAIPIQPAMLKNGNGTFLNTANGETGIMRQYVYSDGKWICDAGVNAHTCEHTKDVVKDPTCTEQGYTTHTCKICGYSYTGDVTEATGHKNIVTDAAVLPTCTTTGLTEGAHCADCGAVTTAQEEISALGHDEVVDVAVAPTCTATGLTEGKHCGRCKEVLTAQTVVSATGHTEVVDQAVAPTCTVEGKTEGKHCSVCNTVLASQNVVSAKGHTEVTDAAVPPTCTATGLSEGKHCSVCKEVLVKQNEVSAQGHNEVTENGKPATLQNTGLTEGKHCDRCGEVLTAQEEIAALLNKIEWNMTLAGDLTVNLYVYADDSVKASVTFGEETTEYPVENGKCTIPVKVSAAQMADSIILTITNSNDESDQDVREYTVAGYAQKILEDEKQETYHALVRAMLNYGAAAQKYFDYNTDNIVSGTESATKIPEPTEEMKVNVTNENIRFYGASLVYREKIAVRFYFTGNAEGITFTVNGKPYTATEKNGLWCVEVSDIMPQELNQQITLTAEGVEVSYGPMNYIWRMNQKGDAKLQVLMKELYNYHLAASGLAK